MTQVVVIVLAVLIGVIAGLRALTAPAVVAWGAFLGWIDVDGKWSEWVAHPITVTVLTIFLVVELVTDQLPKTPSRKTPPQFITRLITAAFAGAVIGSVSPSDSGTMFDVSPGISMRRICHICPSKLFSIT